MKCAPALRQPSAGKTIQMIEIRQIRETCRSLLRAFALVAMLLQVLFTADHLGASAVSAFGVKADGVRFGIMEICSGDGVLLIDMSGEGSGGHDCPVCANAAIADFGDTVDAPQPETPVTALALSWQVPRGTGTALLLLISEHQIRAPPSRQI